MSKRLIYMEDAIDALGEKPLVWDDLSDFDLGKASQWSDDVDAIKALPSAQPERKRGKWVYNSPVTMKCNQCGLVIKDWDWHRFKYCPNCISDMRGERE